MSSSPMRYLLNIAILALLSLLLLPSFATAQTQLPACDGAYYTVQRGDTWNSVAQASGITVTALMRANPQAVRANNWLWIGDRLCIPAGSAGPAVPTAPAPEQTASGGYWYQVRPGDTWNSVSRAAGVPVRDLWRANPNLVNRLYWLYIGQRVWIPAGTDATPEPAAQATATPTPRPDAATPTQTPAPIPAGCAPGLADYPDLVLAHLNTAGNTPSTLRDWLTKCGAITGDPDAVTMAALQSATSAAVIVTLHDPALPPPDGNGLLLIYHSSANGYKLARQATGSGSVALLTATDLNADGKSDVVWTDTSCGAHTCFTTLYVDSWNGAAYADWIAGEPTIAAAEYRFQDIEPAGSGHEIIIYGGVIGSVGAGPQRAWTETYVSTNGTPYTLLKQEYDASSCLYHAILDANTVFGAWSANGFEPAITGYTDLINDQTLTACGAIADELTTLRDFARFRLVVALVGNGQQADVQTTLAQITTPAVRGVANAFYAAYRSSRSIIQACRDATAYARANPAAWQFLADWGYANPTFMAEDLCPLR